MMKYLVLFLPWLFVSCGPMASVDFDPETNFSQYNSYDFYPSIDSGLSELDNKRIMGVLDSLMPLKGFQKSESPQILINFYAKEHLTNSRNTIGIGIGSGGGNVGVGVSGGIPIGGTEVEQQLTVDFIDVNADALIWQGILESRYKEKSTPKQMDVHYFDALQKLLRKYPPIKK